MFGTDYANQPSVSIDSLVYERANSATFCSSRGRPPGLPDRPFGNWPLAERTFVSSITTQPLLCDAIFALRICILSSICYHDRSVYLTWCQRRSVARSCVGSSLIEPRRFSQERSQTHESFGAPLFEKAINARIPTLSDKVVVIRQLNRKPPLFLPVGAFFRYKKCFILVETGRWSAWLNKRQISVKE